MLTTTLIDSAGFRRRVELVAVPARRTRYSPGIYNYLGVFVAHPVWRNETSRKQPFPYLREACERSCQLESVKAPLDLNADILDLVEIPEIPGWTLEARLNNVPRERVECPKLKARGV